MKEIFKSTWYNLNLKHQSCNCKFPIILGISIHNWCFFENSLGISIHNWCFYMAFFLFFFFFKEAGLRWTFFVLKRYKKIIMAIIMRTIMQIISNMERKLLLTFSVCLRGVSVVVNESINDLILSSFSSFSVSAENTSVNL